MVADKMYYRSTGTYTQLTRQPVGGRANEGATRIGEMERDSILAHGISSFLKETMMNRSDGYQVQIDNRSGLINYDENEESKDIINIPYSMKLMLQEFQSMSIAPRIITESEYKNNSILNYLVDKI